jgi:hypothetical protein
MTNHPQARAQLERITTLIDQAGLRYVALPEMSFSLGVAVAWSETDVIVVSVPTASPHSAYFTQGLLKDIQQDKLRALEAANDRTHENPEFPVFLHDAEGGWDMLTQQTYPIQLFVDVPPFFESRLQTTGVAAALRAKLQPSLHGLPYRFEEADLNRLLMRAHL